MQDFNFEKFTYKASNAIKLAIKTAGELGLDYTGSEHLLLGILREGTSSAYTILSRNGLNYYLLREKIVSIIGIRKPVALTEKSLTPTVKRVIANSQKLSSSLGCVFTGSEHLLMLLLKESGCSAVTLIKDMNINIAKVCSDCSSVQANLFANVKETKNKKNTPNLERFGRELTGKNALSTFDPCIGRDEELTRIIQIISRRTKNNPCLIGEAGVGKSAIIEALACKIVSQDLPIELRTKRIFNLDISMLLAGAKYRGDFEERLKSCVDEAVRDKDIILFIDEVHTLVGAGAAEGAIDAANILKPQLARGELQIIGATTFVEYKKHIEKDSALERRFQPVIIDEPCSENTIKILKGIAFKYEEHHNVKITENAILAAVNLSNRFITDRFFPDKAIDLIDEACSRVKLKEAKKIKEKSFFQNLFVQSSNSLIEKDESKKITEKDISEVVSLQTGIPLNKLNEAESYKLLTLEKVLSEKIVGQDLAIKSISNSIRRSRIGLKDPDKPISFIFAGPTGVGKTELANTLATSLYFDKNAIIRFDMSEFAEKHSISKLIGSPPGYVGYGEGGQLTEKVRKKPYSIVLFDEIEKAHPDIFNCLLQVLDNGALTDTNGRWVSFKNTLIIMTSNIGAKSIVSKSILGFEKINNDENSIKSNVMNEMKKIFRPEFINRIDEIILFNKLTEENIKEIAKKMLDDLTKRVKALGISVIFTKKALEKLAEQGFNYAYGARELKRIIGQKIENLISDEFIKGEIKSGDSIEIDVNENEFLLKTVLTN